jgi:hypothetical protein
LRSSAKPVEERDEIRLLDDPRPTADKIGVVIRRRATWLPRNGIQSPRTDTRQPARTDERQLHRTDSRSRYRTDDRLER